MITAYLPLKGVLGGVLSAHACADCRRLLGAAPGMRAALSHPSCFFPAVAPDAADLCELIDVDDTALIRELTVALDRGQAHIDGTQPIALHDLPAHKPGDNPPRHSSPGVSAALQRAGNARDVVRMNDAGGEITGKEPEIGGLPAQRLKKAA